MRLIPFDPSHLEPIGKGQGAVLHALRDTLSTIEQDAFTALDGNQEVGCAGVFKIRPGVAQAWAVLAPPLLRRPCFLTRSALAGLGAIITERGYKRVQAHVADGHLQGHRWAKFLGFEVEGYLKNFGENGEGNFWLYARIAR